MFTHKSEKGITGLETAIILIAFVVADSKKRRARSNHVVRLLPTRAELTPTPQPTPFTKCRSWSLTLSLVSQST
jgi:flagellin-like protein